jgi:hypothetical protein
MWSPRSYLLDMTLRYADDRVPDGFRRIEVTLPPALVVELDRAIGNRHIRVSRSRIVALAIRHFLDDGGMEMFPTYPDWP